MTDWQILKQFQKIVRSLVWAGGNRYFASSNVFVTALILENFLQLVRTSYPLCTIRLIGSSVDPLYPEIAQSQVKVTVCQSVQGDTQGEYALMGASPQEASSKNRGVLLFEAGLLLSLGKITESGGVKFISKSKSYGDLQFVSESENVSFREYDFEAESTSVKTYQEPLRFRVTGGSGAVSGSWTNPSQFGFSNIVLKRGVTTVKDDTSVSFSDTGLAAGSYTYTLQAFYDDKSGDDDQESVILSKTVTVT